MRFQIRLLIFILGILLYFWVFLIDFFRSTILPTVDHGIAQMIQKTTIHSPETQKECFEKGGIWKAVGIYPKEICRIPYTDATKSCFSGFQCQSKKCITTSNSSTPFVKGTCPTYNLTIGCYSEVHFGIVDKGLCVD